MGLKCQFYPSNEEQENVEKCCGINKELRTVCALKNGVKKAVLK